MDYYLEYPHTNIPQYIHSVMTIKMAMIWIAHDYLTVSMDINLYKSISISFKSHSYSIPLPSGIFTFI